MSYQPLENVCEHQALKSVDIDTLIASLKAHISTNVIEPLDDLRKNVPKTTVKSIVEPYFKELSEVEKKAVVYVALRCRADFFERAEITPEADDVLYTRGKVAEGAATYFLHAGKWTWHTCCEEVLTWRFHPTGYNLSENALELGIRINSKPFFDDLIVQRAIKSVWNGHLKFIPERTHCHWHLVQTCTGIPLSQLVAAQMMRPKVQYAIETIAKVVQLVLFTMVLVTGPPTHKIEENVWESLFYLWTLSLWITDLSVWHLNSTAVYFSRQVIRSLWNWFDQIIPAVSLAAFSFRVAGDWHTSFAILCMLSPLLWVTMLTALDAFPFYSTMLMVVYEMIRASAVFIVLLTFVFVGFAEGFFGLQKLASGFDGNEGRLLHSDVDSGGGDKSLKDIWGEILFNMISGVLMSPAFSKVTEESHPVAGFAFYSGFLIISNILLFNLLIASYADAYARLTDNIGQEYLFSFSRKVLENFKGHPERYTLVPPFSLLEVVLWPLPRQGVIRRMVGMVVNGPVAVLCWLLGRAEDGMPWEEGFGRVHVGRERIGEAAEMLGLD